LTYVLFVKAPTGLVALKPKLPILTTAFPARTALSNGMSRRKRPAHIAEGVAVVLFQKVDIAANGCFDIDSAAILTKLFFAKTTYPLDKFDKM